MIRHLMLPCALLLTGCASMPLPQTVEGGECKIKERPPYAVEGRTAYDQRWIDGEIEAGVAACKWKRPAPRPPELDAQRLARPAVAAPKRKHNIVQRVKDRVSARSQPAELSVPTAPVVEPDVWNAEPAPRPAPEDPVDELLGVAK